jgi:glycosyltransferase involved in cell wall biosynthesis
VCSGNLENYSFEINHAYIAEQIEAIHRKYPQVKFSIFQIKGQGWLGYLSNYKGLIRTLKEEKINLIHAHYSLSSLLANLQRKIPVITTFHGSDINFKINNFISSIVNLLTTQSIFVSEELNDKILLKTSKRKLNVIPCGIDLTKFYPTDKQAARRQFNLQPDRKYILFSSSFSYRVKNYPLAKKAIDILKDSNVELLELKNYRREEVNILLNASDIALLTSFKEGSPQFIKEAMACNCPIVSTDVGDVKILIQGTEGCYLTNFTPEDVSEKIKKALGFQGRTDGRDKILHLNNENISERIYNIYLEAIKNANK